MDKNFCLGQPPDYGPVHPLSQPPLDPQPLGAPRGQQKKGCHGLNMNILKWGWSKIFVHSFAKLFRFCGEVKSGRGGWPFAFTKKYAGDFSFRKHCFLHTVKGGRSANKFFKALICKFTDKFFLLDLRTFRKCSNLRYADHIFLWFAYLWFAGPIFCGLKTSANPQIHSYSPYKCKL